MSLWFLLLSSAQLDVSVQQQLLTSLKSLDQFQVNFVQQTYSDFLDDTVAEGELIIQRPGKMRMRYLKGDQKLLIWDGRQAYEKDFLADTESLQEMDHLKQEPLAQILLYGSNLLDHFLIDRIEVAGKEIFRLRPRQEGDYEVLLELDSQNHPSILEVVGNDGEGTRFHFSNFSQNPSLDASTFQIPAPTAENNDPP